MEILSPVGSPESLPAAIKAGADAIYLAGKSFGARAFAGNFNDSELEGAVGYAHDHHVKVHVTVNTLIKNREMDEAVSFVRFLKDIGADAVIVQDLGLLKNLASIDIPKHASTQMQVHSAEGLRWCAENGLDRAVLARELTMEELASMVPDSPVETEVFIQGALCYCISGGCLMSSHIGGRSGNRGSCAQPCRKKYTTDTKTGYLMSCADLFGMDYMDGLRDLGVTSLKIEGRMRSPAYSYLATKAYAMAERGKKGEEFDETMELLRTVFNRGTCEGYLGGVVSPVQSLYPDNRGFFIADVKISNGSIDPSQIVEPVGLKDGLSIFEGDAKIGGFKVMDLDPIHVPFKIKDGRYSIYRTYDPRIDEVKNLIGGAPKLSGSTQRKAVRTRLPNASREENRTLLSFYVSTIKTMEAALPYADRIYFDGFDKADEAREICTQASREFVTLLPRFDPLDEFAENVHPVMVNTVGQYRACKGARRIYGSSVLNAFNSHFPLDLHQVTLSTELSKPEIADMVAHYPGRTEVMAFGRAELMVTRDPGMESCTLRDETGAGFPVYKDRRGYSHVLNSVDLYLVDSLLDLKRMGVSSAGIDLRKRPPALAKAVGEMCFEPSRQGREKLVEMCGGATTRGLYQRGV
ncbi:MAG: U32 family peptidase [Candidatus Methanomethylophilaceae archaeon]|nr:U32 family peptidase [Candidatus Methanomethylophilaceae archaeon]